MLSDIEKEKIKALETYRMEAMEEILNKKGAKSTIFKVLSFFNSKIGIWILSVIFASGGLKAYEDYKTKNLHEAKNKEIVEKLDLEISHKFIKFFWALDLIVSESQSISVDNLEVKIEEVQALVLGMESIKSDDPENLYPEYANRSLISLMLEQKRALIQLGISDPELDRVIGNLSNLSAFFAKHEKEFANITGIKNLIVQEMMLPRWENYGIKQP
ncbi:hypothetical protein [Shivajiella indica]|uniref:Uncharacterized protein n=1 Tax=Shivajiella indica TaxID=872115 RepID=A0ABW5BBY3_9BACT